MLFPRGTSKSEQASAAGLRAAEPRRLVALLILLLLHLLDIISPPLACLEALLARSIQASGDPRDLSTLDQPCACAGIPSAFRMGAPKEKGRLRKSGGHQGGLKEKRGYWGTGGLKPASTLGKEQEPQRGKKS